MVNDAEGTSSVNTVYLDNNDAVIGENTDVFGLQAAYLKEVDNALSRKALIIGAGGVSPSVILSGTCCCSLYSVQLAALCECADVETVSKTRYVGAPGGGGLRGGSGGAPRGGPF